MNNSGSYSDEELLPISGLQHLLFCRRRAALVQIEGLWQDNIFTTTGTINQERIDAARAVETRPGITVTRGLLVRSLSLGVTGKCDIVEFHPSGSSNIKTPFPVEHKRGHYRPEPGYIMQLCAQAICLEEMLDVPIESGAIFFATNKRRLKVDFTKKLRKKTINACRALHKLVMNQQTPTAGYVSKCDSCSMINLCQPENYPGAKRSLSQYLADLGG
jgi:CRISPR-associated exonuclease Cas4